MNKGGNDQGVGDSKTQRAAHRYPLIINHYPLERVV